MVDSRAMSFLLLLALQDLTDATFEKLRDAIRPTDEELVFMKVGWRPTFWDAVREAQETDKPILLWAMNGHPLALC